MTGEHYPISDIESERFFFRSIGPSGNFQKLIWFSKDKKEYRYYLALMVWYEGRWVDNYETNNNDFIKTIYTVAFAVSIFFEKHPETSLRIFASDYKRLRVYNGIFKRNINEIEELYEVWGIIGKERKEPYMPENDYIGFEIPLKKT